jgi:hypothetical protein
MRPLSRRRTRGSKNRWTILLLGGLGLIALLAVMTPALFMGWVRHQIQQASFHGRLEALAGQKLTANVRLAPFHWTGDNVSSAGAEVVLAGGGRAEAHGLHLGLDWSAF